MTLKSARQKAGLTQIELAERLKVTQPLVNHWEMARTAPTPEHREEMDTIFTEQVDWVSEFEPLDDTEQQAAFRFAVRVSEAIDSRAASRMIFNNTKYNIRQLLKQNGFLPADYLPQTVELLLPTELVNIRRRTK